MNEHRYVCGRDGVTAVVATTVFAATAVATTGVAATVVATTVVATTIVTTTGVAIADVAAVVTIVDGIDVATTAAANVSAVEVSCEQQQQINRGDVSVLVGDKHDNNKTKYKTCNKGTLSRSVNNSWRDRTP